MIRQYLQNVGNLKVLGIEAVKEVIMKQWNNIRLFDGRTSCGAI